MQHSRNCTIKGSSLFNNKCLHQFMVYKKEVTTNTTYKEYYGMSKGKFKSRYHNHTQSPRQISHINDTELSKCLRTLTASDTSCHLKWSIKMYASSYKYGTRRCDLCLTKRLVIALADPIVKQKNSVNNKTSL